MKKIMLVMFMCVILTLGFTYVDSNFPNVPPEYIAYKVDNPTFGSSYTNGEISVDVQPYSVSWTSTIPIYYVFIKGGPGGHLYHYPDGAYSGSGETPLNPGGQKSGVSHVTFYYLPIQPPPVEPPPVEPPPVEPPPVEPPPVEPPPVEPPPVEPPSVEPPPVEPPPVEPPPVEPPPVEPPIIEPPPVEPPIEDPIEDPILDIPVGGVEPELPQTGANSNLAYYLSGFAMFVMAKLVRQEGEN